jgi:hypothetical protein
MAMLTQTHKLNLLRIALIKQRDEIIEKLIPRRCMVVAVSLILAGLSMPLLMTIELLPVNLLLSFIGFALTVTGGALTLIFYGEL